MDGCTDGQLHYIHRYIQALYNNYKYNKWVAKDSHCTSLPVTHKYYILVGASVTNNYLSSNKCTSFGDDDTIIIWER